MPRYFFDTSDAGNLSQDEHGAEFVDDGEARDEAVALLTAMAKDDSLDGDQREFVASVRNEAGAVVYEASLTLNGRWWPGRR